MFIWRLEGRLEIIVGYIVMVVILEQGRGQLLAETVINISGESISGIKRSKSTA